MSTNRINYNNKIDGGNPQNVHEQEFWYQDANEIKATVNVNADQTDVNTAQVLINTENLRSNTKGIVFETPNIDWTGTAPEQTKIRDAINSGTLRTVPNNTAVYYYTKKVVYTQISNQDNYELITKRWEEMDKYTPTGTPTPVATIGTGGNITLTQANSTLRLVEVEKYLIVDGTITNGLVEDFNVAVTNISTTVNNSTTDYFVQEDQWLFVDNTGKQWIYIGNESVIGKGSTTVDGDYLELTSAINNPPDEPTGTEIKVFDVNNGPKLSGDLLLQDTNTVTVTKNVTTGALEFNSSGGGGGSSSVSGGNFTGVFDVTQDRSVFYNDLLTGSPVSLSLSNNPVLGANASVRINSGLISSIPLDWKLTGDPIDNTNQNIINELTVLYVAVGDVRIVNRAIHNGAVEVEYQALLDYAVANSYILPTQAQQEIDNKKVRLLKETGVWQELDKAHIFNGQYSPTSFATNFYRLNWKNPSNFTITSDAGKEPTWVSGSGFKFEGVTGDFCYTGFTPAIDGVNMSLNNWSEIIKVFDVPATFSTIVWFYGGRGVNDKDQCLIGNSANNRIMARMAANTIGDIQQLYVNKHYHFLRETDGTPRVVMFREGTVELNLSTEEYDGLALPNAEQYLGAVNLNGVLTGNTEDLGVSYILTGSALSGQRVDIYNILNNQNV